MFDYFIWQTKHPNKLMQRVNSRQLLDTGAGSHLRRVASGTFSAVKVARPAEQLLQTWTLQKKQLEQMPPPVLSRSVYLAAAAAAAAAATTTVTLATEGKGDQNADAAGRHLVFADLADGTKRVSAGSMQAIVDYIVEANQLPEEVYTLFVSYRLHCSASDLFAMLERKFIGPDGSVRASDNQQMSDFRVR
jgi:hypothetical protein